MSTVLEQIEQQIAKLSSKAVRKNTGVIRAVADGVAKIDGLSDVMYNEMVSFPGGAIGIALPNVFGVGYTTIGQALDGRIAAWTLGALLVALCVGVASLTFGFEALATANGARKGIPAFPFLMFGVVSLVASALDVRMIRAGGLRGAARLTRHLWRMCYALFIAALGHTAAAIHIGLLLVNAACMALIFLVLRKTHGPQAGWIGSLVL